MQAFRAMYLVILLIVFIGCSNSDENLNPPEDNNSDFQPAAIQDIVMYEVNIGAFSNSGDLSGIINRLDNLKALGINTLWLMPIHPVGIENSFGSPYCIRDYMSVNSHLGTLQNLKVLVAEAHERDIAVIMDWVANHTSWDHPWLSNPGWHTTDANGNVISPAGTNWNDVADLNFDNGDMRSAMIDAMKYWVQTADIDGFRCDAADFVPFDFWQQAITELNNSTNKDLLLLAEGNRADHFNAGFDLNFAWDYLNMIKSVFDGQNAANLFTINASEYAVVGPGKEKLRFTTNHDESNHETPIAVFGSKSAALTASVITIFMDGVPLLYSGQEVGAASPSVYSNVINWNANNDMLLAYTKMLQIYNTSEAARSGIIEGFTDPDIVVFQKTTASERILVLANTRSSNQSAVIPSTLQGDWINALTGATVGLSENIELAAHQYLILKKQ